MNKGKIIKIEPCSVSNGIGCRVVVWFDYCPHHCKGCQNQETWNGTLGHTFTYDDLLIIKKYLDKPYIKGITFSGGEPLCKRNKGMVSVISNLVKYQFPDKDIWCYTGYKYEEVKSIVDIYNIDYLVDGKYIEEQRDVTLAFRGSLNQRIIDVKQSKKENKIKEIDYAKCEQ